MIVQVPQLVVVKGNCGSQSQQRLVPFGCCTLRDLGESGHGLFPVCCPHPGSLGSQSGPSRIFVLINILRFLTSVLALKEPVEDVRARAVLCWRDLHGSSHTHRLSQCAIRFDK